MIISRQLRINVKQLHNARRNLQANNALSEADRKVLLDIIQDSEGRIYPSQMAIDRHNYHLSQVIQINPHKDKSQFDYMADLIDEFERKYCR